MHNFRWVRLISDDPNIRNAVPPHEFLYDHNAEAAVLDKVSLKCKGVAPLLYQPENVIINNEYPLSRKGRINYLQAEKLVERKKVIFHSTEKKVHSDELKIIPEKEHYSLILIKPFSPVIHVKTWEDGNKKISCSFEYNNKQYRFFSVTDHNMLNHYLKKNNGDYSLKGNLLFVISLGELYYRGSCHYKLIASVIFDPTTCA